MKCEDVVFSSLFSKKSPETKPLKFPQECAAALSFARDFFDKAASLADPLQFLLRMMPEITSDKIRDLNRRLERSASAQERREIIFILEPLLDSVSRVETEILFPALRPYLGFYEWIERSLSYHSRLREIARLVKNSVQAQQLSTLADEFCLQTKRYLHVSEGILYPRLIQAMNHEQLLALQNQIGDRWLRPLEEELYEIRAA
jgi:hypothetical protein